MLKTCSSSWDAFGLEQAHEHVVVVEKTNDDPRLTVQMQMQTPEASGTRAGHSHSHKRQGTGSTRTSLGGEHNMTVDSIYNNVGDSEEEEDDAPPTFHSSYRYGYGDAWSEELQTQEEKARLELATLSRRADGKEVMRF